MTNDYDYWLDLDGNERQNKKTRYNKVMEKINSNNLAIDGYIIIAHSFYMSTHKNYTAKFKILDELGNPVKNQEVHIRLLNDVKGQIEHKIIPTDSSGIASYLIDVNVLPKVRPEEGGDPYIKSNCYYYMFIKVNRNACKFVPFYLDNSQEIE